MKCGICVCGLNGSGKTTLAGALAKELNFKHMDIEQYYFISTDNPYSSSRTREEVELIKSLLLWEKGDRVSGG